MNSSIDSDVLDAARARFLEQKKIGEGALAQCPDASLLRVIAPGSNSIAVIVHHLSGNLRSRWTDFLTQDGEKTDRNRDDEFIERTVAREEIMNWWGQGWTTCLDALAALTPADVSRSVVIRGQSLTVVDALYRNLSHTSHHIGQIVLLAKAFAGDTWRTLSIPRGASEAYTRQLAQK